MSLQYFGFARTVVIALLLAMAPLFVANFTLNQFAERRALTEMQSMGEVAIHRAEEAVSATVSLLQRLDRDDVQTCSGSDRAIFEELIIDFGMIDAIGLADATGRRMCITPDRELSDTVILPPLRSDGPLVGIGMLERKFLGARAAVISWDLKDQTRLFAEVTPAVIAMDPGPDYLRSYRRTELRLGGDLLWYDVGGYNSEGNNPEDILTVEVGSALYPLVATVNAPLSAAKHVVNDLKVIAAAASVGMAIVFVAIGVWLSWRPENEANDEFVAAIRNGEFIPYYQPVMDIESKRVRGCEVLMRWRRPNGMIVSPGQFMAYAENNGHIFDMTRHMMRVASEEIGPLYGENPDFKLSINLFAGHFLDREIVSDIKAIFERSEISYQQIVVEVTERHPLEDMDLARKIMAELQAMGVRVALDDVGTGHGGMAYLQKLGVDIIKIDKMFIDSISSDDSSTTIVDSMVELADNLGMGIIAEGVEEEEQIERLLELGVTAAQGYYFAAPMAANDFIEYAATMEEEAQERARLAAEAAAAEQAATESAMAGAAA
nr:EAL domain-containing protein [Roseibium denhamense]